MGKKIKIKNFRKKILIGADTQVGADLQECPYESFDDISWLGRHTGLPLRFNWIIFDVIRNGHIRVFISYDVFIIIALP